MKKTIPILFLILLYPIFSYSYHILGGDLSYKFISSNGNYSTYKITLRFFEACAMIPSPSDVAEGAFGPEIHIFKDGVKFKKIALDYDENSSNIDVSSLCPDEKNNSNCIDPSNFYQGVYQITYSGTVELTGTDANWSFIFLSTFVDAGSVGVGACRIINNAYVRNFTVEPPLYDKLYLIAKLNNTNGSNSSPVFTSSPVQFFCKNKKTFYNVGAADADNDSLSFELISGRVSTASAYSGTNPGSFRNTIYVTPIYSYDRPISTDTNNFYFDKTNGQMIYTSNRDTNSMVVIQTNEYRNGIIIGTSMRSMTFISMSDCNAAAPDTRSENFLNFDHTEDQYGNLHLSVCEGQEALAKCDINCSDSNSDNITVSFENLPVGLNIDIENNGTQNPIAHIVWNLMETEALNYFVYLTYTDDGCPYLSKKIVSYYFTVVPHNIKFQSGSSGSCLSFADGKAWVSPIGETTIDYTYKWVDTATGIVLRNISSKLGDTLTNVPPGVYKVYIRNNDGCGKNIIVKVDTSLLPQLQFPSDTTICKGMFLSINNNDRDATTFHWNTGESTCCIKAIESGTYTVNATNHCGTSTASVNLDVVKCNYCFFIPNAFTPNVDGSNDVFKITATCLTYKYKLFIYNRMGQLVFNSYDLENSWDGTYKGHEAQAGTYYYVLDAELEDKSIENGKVHLTGDITIVK